ncbi:serine proteinase stubble isoform X1 [Bombus terrestris]|uniref:Serine proteinase stubble isoform X1 n=2 Tax=Bombus terrestris TaxID=30195 RepID=A0A9B2JS68_BOMTE|nr:serine proteinase stubble isoform X1 [Bombus terrestris]
MFFSLFLFQMWDRERKTWIVVFLANVLLNTVTASPIYVPQFIPGSTGRNIRHLPCVSRRTGETGVCMFAFTCAKANGTHLGTCIDRFYFGSCCKIDEEPDIFPQDNSIDDGSPARPFVTTHGPIESNDIPEYFSRPKPINEKKPTGTYSTEETTSMYTTQSIRTQPTTVKETTKVATKKPVAMTTQRPTTLEISTRPLSTAQTFAETTKFVTKKPIHSTTTHKPTFSSSYKPTHSSSYKPTHSSSYKPVHSTVHRPTNATTPKPLQSTVDRTTESTTSKTIITTTQRISPITRFPPRNATTARPLTHATTRKPTTSTKKPVTSSSTRRPTATTKKPIIPSKRPPPSTTIRPSVNTTLSTLSSTTTTKPLLTSIKRPTIATTTENVAFSTVTKPVSSTTETVIAQKFTTIATTRPTQKVKPTTVRTTTPKPLTTTPKPLTTTPKPLTTVPRPKPTKISTTTPSLISKPDYATTTEKTGSLSSINVTTVAITKPKPTVESTKPTKPPSKPTSKPISKPTVKPTIKPISKPSSTTPTTLLSSTATNVSFASSPSINTTTTTPAYVTSTKVSVVNQTFEETSHTTYTPGLVTWTSSSDDTTTKNPETFSTTTTQLDQTESEWTPITTPDGWIMIQSPTTKKPQTVEDTTDKLVPESTSQFSTSAKPTTETGTEHEVTKRPTILTTLSSIASVTIDTELPVPMETLNMSDYKQVCGRRLFPESRIVGGNRSSFGKWPWQISLRQWRTSTYLHKCGAALLNENWAITAAHCVENVPPSDLLLRIGEHDLANEDEPYGYQERRVQIVASHPQFDPRTFEYDLALLRFYEPLLPFQPNVLPICLPDDDESYVGRTAYVTGWGRLYDEGPLPSVLQEVAVPVINNTMCEVMYRNAGYIEHIPHIFICAGWRNGEYDSCEGDSGGPMVIQRARDKRWILAGVISWGIGCAVPNQPGVYTRISEFREWINQILQF